MKAKTTGNTGKHVAGKPSLYSFNSGARDSAEIFSILDALEPRRSKSAVWWRAGLLALVAMLAGALYLAGRDVDLYQLWSPAASGELALGRTIIEQQAPEPAPAATAAREGAPAAVPIVADGPLPHTGLQADAAGAAKDGASPALDAALAATPAPASAALAKDASSQGVAAPGAGEKAAISGRKQESRPLQPAPASDPPLAQRTGADSDVDLIAALVAHVSHAEAGGKGAGKSGPKAARARAESAIRKERPIESSRDIVVRNDEDTTEALVARCRALGLIEGELCRLRICSGRWGIDAACPGTPAGDGRLASGR